jgi:hypothetical protein
VEPKYYKNTYTWQEQIYDKKTMRNSLKKMGKKKKEGKREVFRDMLADLAH